MARRHGTGETLQSARKHLIIKEIQAGRRPRTGRAIRVSQNHAPADRGLAARAGIDDCVMRDQKRRRGSTLTSPPRQAMEAQRPCGAQRDRAVDPRARATQLGPTAPALATGAGAVAVALVLSVASLSSLQSTAAAFDSSARLASGDGTITSEPSSNWAGRRGAGDGPWEGAVALRGGSREKGRCDRDRRQMPLTAPSRSRIGSRSPCCASSMMRFATSG